MKNLLMTRPWKQIFLVSVILSFTIAGGSGCAFGEESPTSSPTQAKAENFSGNAKEIIPSFTIHALDGKEISVEGKGDNVLILNFWATWCPPCQEEIPELAAFAKEHPEIRFYAIDLKENASDVKAFLQKPNFSALPAYIDTKGDVARHFRVSAIPTTIIANKNGEITLRKTGGITKSELEAAVNAAKE